MRAHRAGAQTSLHRLLATGRLDHLAPVLVCDHEGWLTGATRSLGVQVEIVPFPSSRALGARLRGNRRFGAEVVRRVPDVGVVLANDHIEGLLAQQVARRAGVPWQAILRSAGMRRRDADKYAIAAASEVWAVGWRLRELAAGWLEAPVRAYPEGVLASEWGPLRPRGGGFPRRVLLAGSADPGKGWADLWAALERLPDGFPPVRWTCTGVAPEVPPRLPGGHEVEFVGRVEEVRALIEQFELVVHPSRAETFGLFVLEAWAAGVPTLATRCGLLEAVELPAAFTCAPEDPEGLAAALEGLRAQWSQLGPPAEAARAALRAFEVEGQVAPLVRALESSVG